MDDMAKVVGLPLIQRSQQAAPAPVQAAPTQPPGGQPLNTKYYQVGKDGRRVEIQKPPTTAANQGGLYNEASPQPRPGIVLRKQESPVLQNPSNYGMTKIRA